MKNQNQAEVKTAKASTPAPDEKPLLLRDAILTRSFTADDPLKDVSSFIVELEQLGDTMEPEIPSGSRAVVTRREDMGPRSGELVLGLLKTGHLIFGVFHTPVHYPKMGLWQICCINGKYPPAHYLPRHFHWIYPVEFIQVLDGEGYLSLAKHLEYIINDDSLDDVLK